jgi:hypothetical protein
MPKGPFKVGLMTLTAGMKLTINFSFFSSFPAGGWYLPAKMVLTLFRNET